MCINIILTWQNTANRSQLDVDCDLFVHAKYQFIIMYSLTCAKPIFQGVSMGLALDFAVGHSGEISICE
jgi:hypothetical protein